MAVIGSRANGTRVPQGGGFGPASDFSQNGVFNPDAPRPASERRDVTFLGRPALPAAPEPARATSNGSAIGANSLADVDLPPLDARSDLFVKSTADRIRRKWFDTVAQDERALDPLAATGFAGGIRQRFEDFTAKTLGDMPETLRPHIADSLARVGREIETRAADFETTASPVGVFNQTKQALDDITAPVAHERFDAQRLRAEGLKRIAEAPLNEGAQAILRGYFLADLPVKTALSHIDDDPDDALAALRAAESRKRSGKAKDGSGSAEASAPGSLADGADGEDGEFDPALFYADIAPEVRSGLKANARITSARRRESARIEITKSLEQGIAANTVTAARIETAKLDTDDKVRLHAQLKTARAEDERDAEAAERYITDPKSFDRDNPVDRAMADRGFRIHAGETDNAASALSIGPDGVAVDVIDLAARFSARAGFLPDAAVERLRFIAKNGSPKDRARAAMHLDESNVPLTEDAVPPELADETEAPAPPSPPSEQPGLPPETSGEASEVTPEEQKKEEETSAFGVLFEVVDIVTNFVPVVSEAKAAYQAYQLSIQLSDAMERGDEATVRQLSADLALTMTDLLPGPNIAGTIGKIGNRADRLPLIQTLKEKLQRLWNKAKGSDGSNGPDAKGQDEDNGGSSSRVADQSSGDLPDPNDPLQDNRRREISQAKKGDEVINGIHKKDYVKRFSGDLVKRDRNALTDDELIAEFDNNEALAKELGGFANGRFSNDPWDREIDIVDDAFFIEAKGMASLGKDKRQKIKEAFEGAKATGRRIIYHSPEAPIDSNVQIFRRYSERYGVELEIIYGKPGSLRNVRIPRLGDD